MRPANAVLLQYYVHVIIFKRICTYNYCLQTKFLEHRDDIIKPCIPRVQKPFIRTTLMYIVLVYYYLYEV